MKPDCPPRVYSGFSLVELTVVLILVGLLIGGLMIPLSTQQDLRAQTDTEKQLVEIKEALIGYAIVHGRFPCPMKEDTSYSPSSNSYGVEDATQCDKEGMLPWKTIGVSEVDAWGPKRSAAGENYVGYFRYRAHKDFTAAFTAATSPTAATALQIGRPDSAVIPPLLHTTEEPPVLVVYSTGPDKTRNGRNTDSNASYDAGDRSATFDDMLIWISRPALFARLAAAGALKP